MVSHTAAVAALTLLRNYIQQPEHLRDEDVSSDVLQVGDLVRVVGLLVQIRSITTEPDGTKTVHVGPIEVHAS